MLPLSFFLIASLYSIAGFGGGSSYLALLAYLNTPFTLLPMIGLICNLIVVLNGSFSFKKRNEVNYGLTLPLIFSSAPMAYLGGLIKIEKDLFFLILGLTLFLSSLRLLITPVKTNNFHLVYSKGKLILIGSLLGFLAGIVSIGGGIFLSPILLNIGWGHPREVASTATFFILINSIFGLAGHLTKNPSFDFLNYYPLFLAVFAGSFIGIRLRNLNSMTSHRLQKVTAILVFFISINILRKLL